MCKVDIIDFEIKVTNHYNLENFCEKYKFIVKKIVKDDQLGLKIDFPEYGNLTQRQKIEFGQCCKATFDNDTNKKLKSERKCFNKRKWKRKDDKKKRQIKNQIFHNHQHLPFNTSFINTFPSTPPSPTHLLQHLPHQHLLHQQLPFNTSLINTFFINTSLINTSLFNTFFTNNFPSTPSHVIFSPAIQEYIMKHIWTIRWLFNTVKE